MSYKIKPTIYLLKRSVANIEDIFNDPDKLENITEGNAWLYYKNSQPHPPKWFSFVGENFGIGNEFFRNSSSYAVMVIHIAERFFAVPLGMGGHLINMSKIESNFGLKVAINCVPSNELRQLDLTTPEFSSQKTKKQATKSSSPEDFGINKRKDILRGVVGKLPDNHILGERIEGKDSIRISKSVETLAELNTVCEGILGIAVLENYKENYPWIDNISAISDSDEIETLYMELIRKIQERNFEDMHIAPPEFIDELYSYEGFKFTGDGKRNKSVKHFPSVAEVFQEYDPEFIQRLNRKTLSKTCKVFLVDSEGVQSFGWGLNKCIHFEIERDVNKYILSEGNWYKVEPNFYNEINQFYKEIVLDNNDFPEMPQGCRKESDYNFYVCKRGKYKFLFDLGHQNARDLHINNGNEICDIYDAMNKEIIHLKIGKSSSSISHLLRQAVFSAQILKRDNVELQKFLDYLRNVHNCEDQFIPDPFNPSDHKLIFVLLLNNNQRASIPFFSKVSFKDAVEQTFDMLDYKIHLTFVYKEAALEKLEEVA